MGTLTVKNFYDKYLTSADKAGMLANEWVVTLRSVGGTQYSGALVDFYVNDITLPNKELIEVQKSYRGRKFSAPAGFKYAGDVEMNIDCDTNLVLYSIFANMIHAVSPFVTVGNAQLSGDGTGITYDGDGQITDATWAASWTPTALTDGGLANVTIKLGSTANGGTYSVFGAFPTSISGVTFENGAPGIATYKVVMAYAYFDYAVTA